MARVLCKKYNRIDKVRTFIGQDCYLRTFMLYCIKSWMEARNMLDFENLQNYREDNRIEAKEALGGLPESLWETYSAFANADGGVILLGVEEMPDKSLHALDLLDPQWLIDDFRAILNDPAQVSINILTEDAVQIHEVEGRRIISITVPKALPEQMPVYVGGNPYRGTYRRSGEGDYRLSREEVEEMLRR